MQVEQLPSSPSNKASAVRSILAQKVCIDWEWVGGTEELAKEDPVTNDKAVDVYIRFLLNLGDIQAPLVAISLKEKTPEGTKDKMPEGEGKASKVC